MRKIVHKHIEGLYPQYAQQDMATPIHKDDAYPIVDQFFFGYFNKGMISTWNKEDRFSKEVVTKQVFDIVLDNSKTTGYVAINRKFEPQCDGKICMQTVIDLHNADNGARVYLENIKGENVFEIVSKNGFFHAVAKSDVASTAAVHEGSTYFKADFDLDTRKGSLYIDGVFACDFELAENYENLFKVTVSTSDGCPDLTMQMRRMYIRRNYAVDENFYAPVVPCDWECGKAEIIRVYNDAYESGTLKLYDTTTAKKCYRTLTGKVILEAFYFLPEKGDSLTIDLGSLAKLYVKDAVATISDITHNFIPHIWQSVRLVADMDKGEGEVYICGKPKGKIKIEGKQVSSICFDYEKNSSGGYALIDDVRVYNTFDYPDYCPEPKAPAKKNVNAIMSVCSLWHEGAHHGYDYVAPYDECTPLMGYYDEGIPECSDWETKLMVEQGISAFEYCWFTPQAENPHIPIKTPRAFWHQLEGYFYGKYSHMLPFCIMWENNGWGRAKMDLETFKKFVWDYWVEWNFRDDRYYRIDNKAYVHFYRHNYFLSTFGSVEKCREVLDFMREEIKKYGYDGMIITVNCGDAHTPKVAKLLSDMGFDGVCNYGLGKPSFNPDFINYATGRIIDSCKNAGSDMFVVPTVGTGWNIMGWEDTRTPLATPEQYGKSVENAIKLNEKQGNTPNVIFLSTWNEYGEGHWLAPSGLNGFGYADAQRKIICGDTDVKHVVPTESQMARIAHLHNDYRAPIRSWLYELPDVSKLDCDVVFSPDLSISAWDFEDANVSQDADGSIVMDAYDVDPKCIYKASVDVAAENVDYIHLRIMSQSPDTVQFFFTTEREEPFGFYATGYMDTAVYETGKYVDYYIETKHKEWHGTIKNIRIDTGNSPACAKIAAVEFLKLKPFDYDFGVVVDGASLKIPFHYKSIENGEYYLAANPKNGIFSATNIYHEWDRFEGKLLLRTSTDVEFLFTVGSDVVVINGKEEKLQKAFRLHDMMPVLPMKFVLDKAGLVYEIKDNSFFIKVR